ncbi:hypothetical protein [endosymbiont GvMRE of Glomus versiforme]|uniref:hypothetical protein n=1 Tax=endosymbiont GvMRE of Glomus versiforme TaxID=2039283 RepID=UPI003CCC496F
MNAEDNKWVNRFNKIIFDRDFLGKEKDGATNPRKEFWNKFINNNPGAEYEPERDEENIEEQEDDDNEPKDKKVKIKWGEFFEFFWHLYDSKQLEAFEGEFINPRNPKLEEVLATVDSTLKLTTNKLSKDICKAIDARLNEMNDTITEIRDSIDVGQNAMSTSIDNFSNEISILLTSIGEHLNSDRGRRRYWSP